MVEFDGFEPQPSRLDKGSLIAALILAAIFVLLIGLLGIRGECATTTFSRRNSIGVDQIYTNPNIYLFGSITGGAVLSEDDKTFTSASIQPYNTIFLYSEQILFCDNVAEQLNQPGPLVITYQRTAHRTYQGVGCHILVSAFSIKQQEN